MNDSFIEEVSNLYGYDEGLKIAISLTIPLLINQYGDSRCDEVYDLFRNVRIFSTNDMSKANRYRIEKEMIGNKNSHIMYKADNDLYQTNTDPGSYYSYQAIYDENMNVVNEARWVVVKDMKGSFNENDYKNMFGTTVNMPYFIHEMSHAFAMQKATYRKEGDKIYSKHGMYEEVISYQQKDGKVDIDSSSLNDVMVEEAINELHTQNMLKDLMKVDDYQTVREQLNSINHVNTSYNSVIVSLAEKLENVLGKEELLKFRKDNDQKVLEEFNELAMQSEITKKYCNDSDPYSMFDKKCFALFLLKNNCYKMPIEDYSYKTKELMMDAFAPLCACQDKKYGTMSLEKFENIRAGILGIQIQQDNRKENEEGTKVM